MSDRKDRLAAGVGAGTLFAFSIACVTSPAKEEPRQAPPPVTSKQEVKVPKFTLVEPTDPAVTKEGIRISVLPLTYEIVERKKVKEVQQTGEHKERRGSGTREDPYFEVPHPLYTITRGPVFSWKPEQPQFLVKINNSMTKVFRMAGAVITYQVNGKQVAIPQKNYESVLGQIVPPRGEGEIDLTGPTWKDLGEKCTLGVFLYDIVTEVDAASNPTKRVNFEWIFSFEYTTESRTVTDTKTKSWNAAEVQQAQAEANGP